LWSINNNPNIVKKKSKTYLVEHKSKEKEKEKFIMTFLIVFMRKKRDVATQRIFVGSQNSKK
jgi:hypothetical protein